MADLRELRETPALGDAGHPALRAARTRCCCRRGVEPRPAARPRRRTGPLGRTHGGRRRTPAAPGGPRAAGGPSAGPGSAPRAGPGPRGLWALPPVAVLALVFLYPLALVVQQSFTPEDGGATPTAPYAAVFAERLPRGADGPPCWLAVGATVGALVLGFGARAGHRLRPVPRRHGRRRFIDVFLSFPSFLITLALLFLYGTVGMANGLWTDLTGAAHGPLRLPHTPPGASCSPRSPTSRPS